MRRLLLMMMGCVAMALAQSNQIQLCDQQATPHCVTISAAGTISADFGWMLPAADAAGYFQSNGSGAVSIGPLPSDLMTTDTAQAVTVTKDFQTDQRLDASIEFYAGSGATSFLWRQTGVCPSGYPVGAFCWEDSGSTTRMYLTPGTAATLFAPSIFAAPVADQAALTVQGYLGGSADLLDVYSQYGGTRVFTIGHNGQMILNGGAVDTLEELIGTSSDQSLVFLNTAVTTGLGGWVWQRRGDTGFGSANGAMVLYGDYSISSVHDHYIAPIMFNPNGDVILEGASGVVNGKVGVGMAPANLLDVGGDSGEYGFLKFYDGTSAPSQSWSVTAACTLGYLCWYDAGSALRMYLTGGTTAGLYAPSIYAIPQSDQVAAIVYGYASGTASMLQVYDQAGGNVKLSVGRSSLYSAAGQFELTSTADTASFGKFNSSASAASMSLQAAGGASISIAVGSTALTTSIYSGGSAYSGATASGCSSFVAGWCVSGGASDMMTTDTAQAVTATKDFQADQRVDAYLKFYAGTSAPSQSWSVTAACTLGYLCWYDSGSALRMYLTGGTTAGLYAPSIYAIPQSDQVAAIVYGYASGTAAMLQVYDQAGGNVKFSVSRSVLYSAAGQFELTSTADTASWAKFNSSAAAASMNLQAAGGASITIAVGSTALTTSIYSGGTAYSGATASGCSSFVAGWCVSGGTGASDMMTTDTAQAVTATKDFQVDQRIDAYLKFYDGTAAPSFSWFETANCTSGYLCWYDSGSALRMYLTGGTTAGLYAPSIYAIPQSDQVAAIVYGYASGTASMLQVYDQAGGNLKFSVSRGVLYAATGQLELTSTADTASWAKFNSSSAAASMNLQATSGASIIIAVGSTALTTSIYSGGSAYSGATKTCTTLPTVVGGIVTGC